MVREKQRMGGGFIQTPIAMLTDFARKAAEQIADYELKDLDVYNERLKEAIKQGSVEKVEKCEKELIGFFTTELKKLNDLYKCEFKVEYRIGSEIDDIMKAFDKLKSKAALKQILPVITELESKVKGLVDKTKNLWERAGDFVQNIQMRNINLAGQFGALTRLSDRLRVSARQQRRLTYILMRFVDYIEKIEADIGEAEYRNDQAELQKKIKELGSRIKEFDQNLNDEFEAIASLRLNDLYTTMVVCMHIHAAMKQLQQMLQGGFPQTTEAQLEGSYRNLIDFQQKTAEDLMRMEEGCYQEISKVFEHIQREEVELRRAA